MMLITVCNQLCQCPKYVTRFHNMDTEIVIVGVVVCLVYVHCLFLQANEGRKDESLTQRNAEYQLWWNLINTICLEGPIINVVV